MCSDPVIIEFKKTSYYADIVNSTDNIIAIYIVGSRACGTHNDYNDYDIIILTLDSPFKNMHDECYIKYNDIKLHWYYCSIDWMLSKHSDTLTAGAFLPIILWDSNSCIYANEAYQYILDKIFAMRNDIFKLSVYNIYSLNKAFLASLQKNGIAQRNLGKKLYLNCLAAYLILGKTLDIKLLKNLKHEKYFEQLSSADLTNILDLLTDYKTFIEDTLLDLDTYIEELHNKWEKL